MTGANIRLDWIAQSVQEVFDLAGLFPDRVKGTWIAIHLSSAGRSKRVMVRQVITRCPADLGHLEQSTRGH
jgi:hypothetical protein